MFHNPFPANGLPRRHSRIRPQLELLEDRTLLNNRFIVPAGLPTDNVTNFATLQAALSAAGLSPGDFVQIDAGSAPGNVTLAAPPVANLTIQGDPNFALSAIPQFTLSNTFTVAAAQAGFTLRNVNMGLISVGAGATNNGTLVYNANGTITGSTIIDINSTAANALSLNGTNNVLTNSTIINNIAVTNLVVQISTPAGGSNNLIANNTFVTNATGTNGELGYFGGTGAPVTDRVVNNTFIANAGVNMFFFLIAQESNLSGLTIQNNTFTGPNTNIGIFQFSVAQNMQILGNTINLGGAGPIGINLNGGGAGTTTSAVVSDNHVSASTNGTGIKVNVGTTATSALNLKIQGNDLHNNKIGVQVTGATGPVTGVDLGGGNQGSLGGNNFRGFTTNATTTAGAIVVTTVAGAQGTIQAQRNLFANGVTPSNVVSDPGGNLNLNNQLTGNAAFVQTLFQDFLHRTSDTTNPGDAGFWVNVLNGASMTAAQVASAISRSPEALGVAVDGLYERILNRDSEINGRNFFIGALQNGATLENVIANMLTSSEFAKNVGSDAGYIQSLYTKLLGRTGANNEVAFWLAQLPSQGRLGVANLFLGSAEFRNNVVQQLYGFVQAPSLSLASLFYPLLHRTAVPPMNDVNFWINSGQDILTLETSFAQTPEYFIFG